MSSTETVRAIEEQLAEAGKKLLQPPSSLDELLPLLDQVENSLAKVEQSPAKSTHAALSPLMKALAADELLRHPDIDVKVAVAACISEITRITAPDAPYEDDKMKDVFQLIVASFEDLSDKSSRSYNKRALILETLAKVRSCVIMLDLECDNLVTEMFQIFFRTIRDDHPESILMSMETIMSLVLDESEDVSTDLLTTLLLSVKRDNEEVSPIARRLGERIFEKCAVKLKPYVVQAVDSLDISLDNYSKIVTSVSEGTAGQNADCASAEQQGDGSKPATESSKEAEEAAKDLVGACLEDIAPSTYRSPKSTMSNGISVTGKEEHFVKVEVQEKRENPETGKTINHELTPKPESDDSGIEKATISESKSEKAEKYRGRKLNSSTKSMEVNEHSHGNFEKKAEIVPDNVESHDKEFDSSARDDKCAEVNQVGSDTGIGDGEAHEGENAASPSPSDSVAEMVPEGLISSNEKASERASVSEAISQKHSGKKPSRETSYKGKTSGDRTSKHEDSGSSDSEEKPVKQPNKKPDVSYNDEGTPSVKRKEDKRKFARGKASSVKDVTKSSTKADGKAIMSSPKRSAKSVEEADHDDKIPNKRKRSLGKGKASGNLEYGQNLIGSKVKVYWPEDREFYEGVVDSFDPVRKKHKVLYNDGDEEILNLRKERWELIGDDSEDEAETATTNVSSEMLKKKKVKKNAISSLKHKLEDVSPKRLSASSSKSKSSASKSSRKVKDSKGEAKSRDGSSKSNESGSKSKTHIQNIAGKSTDESLKSSGKTKDLDSSMQKSKSKHDGSKTGGKSKDDNPRNKSQQSGSKSSTNGVSKVKSSSSKVRGGDVPEKQNDSLEVQEGTKHNPCDVEDERGSEMKSSKKRRRSVKG